jgi:hypothetical protein
MNSRFLTSLSTVVALSVSCFVPSALAEPEGASPQTVERREAERRDDTPPAPRFDPKLFLRLEQLQASRRITRRQAITDAKTWEENRATRASAHRARVAALWGDVVGTIDGQARLRTHAEHLARLNRMLDLAEQKQDAALITRVQAGIVRELERHLQAMLQLQAAAGRP